MRPRSGPAPSAPRVFVVHHNPTGRQYAYDADPTDAVASARALVEAGESGWVAGNCHRLIQIGDLLLFKFAGARLQQEVGIYAAARVTRAPEQRGGRWLFHFLADAKATRHLLAQPVVGEKLTRLVGRSYGASIQSVQPERFDSLESLLSPVVRARPASTVTGHVTHGLIIRKEPLDLILAGQKTWEIRGKATQRRGPIALIEKATGLVVGTCEVVDVVGPVRLAQLRHKAAEWGAVMTRLPYGDHTYGWVLENARRLPEPVRYEHPPGAVIWVKLSASTTKRIEAQAGGRR